MKTKEDVLKAAYRVKREIAAILGNGRFILFEHARENARFTVFTKDCPFGSDYNDILVKNSPSFPRGGDKYKRIPLLRRYIFWGDFIACAREIESDDAKYIIETAALKADKL